MQRPPAWLVDRIRDEIRRGVHLLREEQALSGFEIDAIHFRLFLGGEWQEITGYLGVSEAARTLPSLVDESLASW